MNKNRILIGLRLCIPCAVLVLAACSVDIVKQGREALKLSPCSAEGSLFADLPYEQWDNIYHMMVNSGVTVHVNGLAQASTQALMCTAPEYEAIVPASEELRRIAASLPAWKDEKRLSALSETDFGVVMLEFLRVYECSLNEQSLYKATRIKPDAGTTLDFQTLSIKMKEMQAEIDKEKLIARTAMERTLSIVGGYDRLRPLTLDIECLKRASLDLRNILGLAADASSCLPRIWDAKTSLRDLKEE